MNNVIGFLLVLASLGVLGVFAYAAFYASRTIHQLLGENRALKSAITNLTTENQIGYAKALEQTERGGVLVTRLLFVETDPHDPTRRVLEMEHEVEGDIIHFDALIVKFSKDAVMDGRERALYLWRRVYGENTPPSRGLGIEKPGAEPARYAGMLKKLSMADRATFWSEIWALADDPDRLRALGVQAIYGNVVYKKIRPGLIYAFKIDGQGNLYPESFPAL